MKLQEAFEHFIRQFTKAHEMEITWMGTGFKITIPFIGYWTYEFKDENTFELHLVNKEVINIKFVDAEWMWKKNRPLSFLFYLDNRMMDVIHIELKSLV